MILLQEREVEGERGERQNHSAADGDSKEHLYFSLSSVVSVGEQLAWKGLLTTWSFYVVGNVEIPLQSKKCIALLFLHSGVQCE